MKVGVTLPHFGEVATWERVVGLAEEVEELGFDSVWVRDHVSYRPGVFDPPGRRFIDPFVSLAAIAARTTRLHLGFSVLVPFRHPLLTAQLVGSLNWVARGRTELGVGIGASERELASVGVEFGKRAQLCEDTLEVIARTGAGGAFSFTGQASAIDDAEIDPAYPADGPIWYGGSSHVAVRRAIRHCTGIMPARTSFARLERAKRELQEAQDRGGKSIAVGTAPLVQLGVSREDALRRVGGRAEPLRAAANGREAEGDLAGALIAGREEDVVDDLKEFERRGISCVVLDTRMCMSEYEDTIRAIGECALPALRGA